MVLGVLVLSSLALAGGGRPESRGGDTLWLRLNIPAFELELYRGAERVRRYRVAVGDSAHQTPVGRYSISRMEWNPSWVPPDREWARGETRRAPGPGNPLGPIKLPFRPLYYIHGTAEPGSLGRAVSHGCVRLTNRSAADLGFLLYRLATDTDSIHPPIDGKTVALPLSRPVALESVYRLAIIDEDRLTVYRDIYTMRESRLADAVDALLALGYRQDAIKLGVLESRLARSAGKTVTIPLGDVIHREPLLPGPAIAQTVGRGGAR